MSSYIDSLDRARQAQARRYARLQRRLFLAQLAVTFLSLFLFLWSGLSLRLREALALPLPAAAALFITVVVAGYGLLTLPLSYLRGLALPRHYGLSREIFRGWLASAAKEAGVGWLLSLIVTVVIYLLLSALPEWWWLAATAFTALLSAILSFLAPWFLLPLFFKAQPLPQGELRQRLESLASQAGFQPRGIYSIAWSRKGNTANAMFLGLGPDRSGRIVLTDTLLQEYAPEEMETILAHELGHYRQGHILRLLLFQTGLALAVFALAHLALQVALARDMLDLDGPADLAGLPLLMLAVFAGGLILAPWLLAFSRYLEGQADAFSLRLTGNPQAFARALARLHDQNLAEAKPSRWVEVLFYDHPPLVRRLARAEQFQAAQQAG